MFAWNEPLGRAIRQPLKLLPKSAVIPIFSGPNRGMKWIVGSSTHGCWLGSYERANAWLIHSLCRPGMTVFDVGANVGYYTLLFAKAVGPSGRVFAFEPGPGNFAFLRRHIELNQIGNVSLVEAAASHQTGETRFECAQSMGHISKAGKTTVRTVRLDEFPTTDLIKMDIEGGEIDAIPGAARILSEKRTTWLIALHDSEQCLGAFRSAGYRVQNLDGHALVTPVIT